MGCDFFKKGYLFISLLFGLPSAISMSKIGDDGVVTLELAEMGLGFSTDLQSVYSMQSVELYNTDEKVVPATTRSI